MKNLFLALLLCCSTREYALADSDTILAPEPTPSPRRIPGEEVTTSSGKKMRVWDTSGPVSVNTAAEAGEVPNNNTLPVKDLNVWVGPRDTRRPGQVAPR